MTLAGDARTPTPGAGSADALIEDVAFRSREQNRVRERRHPEGGGTPGECDRSDSACPIPRGPDSRSTRHHGAQVRAGLRTYGRAVRCNLLGAASRTLASPVHWRCSFPITAAGQFRIWLEVAPDSLFSPLRSAGTTGTRTLLGAMLLCQATTWILRTTGSAHISHFELMRGAGRPDWKSIDSARAARSSNCTNRSKFRRASASPSVEP